MEFYRIVSQALCFQLVVGLLIRYVISSLVRRARFERTIREPDNKTIPKNESQLVESIWYCIVYLTLLSWGVMALQETSPRWYEGEFLWARADGVVAHDFMYDVAGHPIAQLYLLFQVAFFVQELISLLFLSVPKKDWIVQAIHHVVTCIILSLSLFSGYQRVALLTLLIHDISDVFMWLAKASKYALEMFINHDDHPIVTVFFVIFATSFFYARFFLLPINVILPTLRESLRFYRPIHATCTTGLVILQCLHIVWGVMILRIVYQKVWLGKELEDVRQIDRRQEKSE